MTYRVAYPKSEWDRAEAWEHLHAQQIPGCPKRAYIGKPWRSPLSGYVHGWTKAHTATEWAWEYRGARQ